MTRAEFEVWSKAYQAAFGPLIKLAVETHHHSRTAEERSAWAATEAAIAADVAVQTWRAKRAGVAAKG